MKKKIETLLQSGRVAHDEEFGRLYQSFLSAKVKSDAAKTAKIDAKSAYQVAFQDGASGRELLLEKLTDFQKSKYLLRYHQADLQLARFRLERWADDYLHQAKLEEKAEKAARKKKAKQADEPVKRPGRKAAAPKPEGTPNANAPAPRRRRKPEE